MNPTRKLNRRSFLFTVAGGAITAGGALGIVSDEARALQVTDCDPSDPAGRGSGRTPRTGVTDSDSGGNADRGGCGRGTRPPTGSAQPGSTGITDSDPTDRAGYGRGSRGGGGTGVSDADTGANADRGGHGRGRTGVTDSDTGTGSDPIGRGRGTGGRSPNSGVDRSAHFGEEDLAGRWQLYTTGDLARPGPLRGMLNLYLQGRAAFFSESDAYRRQYPASWRLNDGGRVGIQLQHERGESFLDGRLSEDGRVMHVRDLSTTYEYYLYRR